ncbi:LCP family protein, partial [Candidatus Margulisiibacteriota bacterium]
LGGVQLEVEEDLRYADRSQGLDINLKKGWQKLSGKQAHDYIRYRDDFDGDIGRITRQRKFLKALRQALSRPSNIAKAPFAIRTVLKEIKTNLPLTAVVRLLNLTRMLPFEGIRPTMISGEVARIRGVGSVWVPDQAAVQIQLRDMAN